MLPILLLGACSCRAQQMSFSILLAVIGISGSLHGIAFSGGFIGWDAAKIAVLFGNFFGSGGDIGNSGIGCRIWIL